MDQVKVLLSGSLMRMLQVRLKGFPADPFAGDGVPNTGGLFALVVKVHKEPAVVSPELSHAIIFQ
jgi:hypothetical protein